MSEQPASASIDANGGLTPMPKEHPGLPTFGTWCPECGARRLKYVGLVVTAEGALLLFACKACGHGREEREPVEVVSWRRLEAVNA